MGYSTKFPPPMKIRFVTAISETIYKDSLRWNLLYVIIDRQDRKPIEDHVKVEVDYSLHFDDEQHTDVTHLLCLHKKSAKEVESSHQSSLRFNVSQVSAINGHAKFILKIFAKHPSHRITFEGDSSNAFMVKSKRPNTESQGGHSISSSPFATVGNLGCAGDAGVFPPGIALEGSVFSEPVLLFLRAIGKFIGDNQWNWGQDGRCRYCQCRDIDGHSPSCLLGGIISLYNYQVCSALRRSGHTLPRIPEQIPTAPGSTSATAVAVAASAGNGGMHPLQRLGGLADLNAAISPSGLVMGPSSSSRSAALTTSPVLGLGNSSGVSGDGIGGGISKRSTDKNGDARSLGLGGPCVANMGVASGRGSNLESLGRGRESLKSLEGDPGVSLGSRCGVGSGVGSKVGIPRAGGFGDGSSSPSPPQRSIRVHRSDLTGLGHSEGQESQHLPQDGGTPDVTNYGTGMKVPGRGAGVASLSAGSIGVAGIVVPASSGGLVVELDGGGKHPSMRAPAVATVGRSPVVSAVMTRIPSTTTETLVGGFRSSVASQQNQAIFAHQETLMRATSESQFEMLQQNYEQHQQGIKSQLPGGVDQGGEEERARHTPRTASCSPLDHAASLPPTPYEQQIMRAAADGHDIKFDRSLVHGPVTNPARSGSISLGRSARPLSPSQKIGSGLPPVVPATFAPASGVSTSLHPCLSPASDVSPNECLSPCLSSSASLSSSSHLLSSSSPSFSPSSGFPRPHRKPSPPQSVGDLEGLESGRCSRQPNLHAQDKKRRRLVSDSDLTSSHEKRWESKRLVGASGGDPMCEAQTPMEGGHTRPRVVSEGGRLRGKGSENQVDVASLVLASLREL